MLINLNLFLNWVDNIATLLDEKKEYLTELDSPIGDADHGTNIARGFMLARQQNKSKEPKSLNELFKSVAMIMMTKVGGASGMLYGNFFLKMSIHLKNDTQALTFEEFIKMMEVGINAIIERGRAKLDDKTMIDVWLPFLNRLKSSNNKNLFEIIDYLVEQAELDAKKTIDMLAKKGRASYLGERSIGHQDPGATSTLYILEALKKTIHE